jgi:hypothetical protein
LTKAIKRDGTVLIMAETSTKVLTCTLSTTNPVKIFVAAPTTTIGMKRIEDARADLSWTFWKLDIISHLFYREEVSKEEGV